MYGRTKSIFFSITTLAYAREYRKQLCLISSLLVVFSMNGAASSSSDDYARTSYHTDESAESSDDYARTSYHTDEYEYDEPSPENEGSKSSDELSALLSRYSAIDLPSMETAACHIERIQGRHPEWRELFNNKVRHLQNPAACIHAMFPSRMVFYGPPGCGKTFAATALAKVCGMTCLFIKGSAVESTFRNSGPVFLQDLFDTLIRHPKQKFLVVFDELIPLVQFSKDERNSDQHKTVMAFWQCLDSIEKMRHICVIGTDNVDPKEYEPQVRERIFNSTFKFKKGSDDTRIRMFCADFTPNVDNNEPAGQYSSYATQVASDKTLIKKPTCIMGFSEETLKTLIRQVSHLSDRELLILRSCAIEAASLDALDGQESQQIIVEDRHLKQAFKPHCRSWVQQYSLDSIAQRIFSVRTLSYCLAIAGAGVRGYDEKYAQYGMGLMFLGQCINSFTSDEKQRAQDILLFNALTNFSEASAAHYRHVESIRRQDDAIERENVRYNRSRLDREEDRTESRNNRTHDLGVADQRYAQSRLDREEDRTESRNNRTHDLGVADQRYAQSRLDREEDRTESRNNRTHDLGVADQRYAQSRLDREEDRTESRNNRTHDLSVADQRYDQSRLDREEDRTEARNNRTHDASIARERYQESHALSLRAQYFKNYDLILNTFEQELQEARSIKDPKKRAAVTNSLWASFEEQFIQERTSRRRELDNSTGTSNGNSISNHVADQTIAFYKKHKRPLPKTVVDPAAWGRCW